MPKVAIFFSIILLSSVLTNSYAFVPGDMVSEKNIQQQLDFSSDILEIDSDFFSENNFKRYIIFGTNSQSSDFLKNNSIYGVHSNNGFFSVSVLSG